MATPPPPPGWYPDQYGTQRWWDGRQWTEHVQPPPAPQTGWTPPGPVGPADVLARQTPLFWWTAAGALGMIVGGFGPWIVALSVLSVSGTERDGPFIIVGGFAVLGLMFVAARSAARINAVLPMIPAAICTVIAAVDLADVLNKPIISPGWGLYMSVIASLVTTALALVQLARGPGR